MLDCFVVASGLLKSFCVRPSVEPDTLNVGTTRRSSQSSSKKPDCLYCLERKVPADCGTNTNLFVLSSGLYWNHCTCARAHQLLWVPKMTVWKHPPPFPEHHTCSGQTSNATRKGRPQMRELPNPCAAHRLFPVGTRLGLPLPRPTDSQEQLPNSMNWLQQTAQLHRQQGCRGRLPRDGGDPPTVFSPRDMSIQAGNGDAAGVVLRNCSQLRCSDSVCQPYEVSGIGAWQTVRPSRAPPNHALAHLQWGAQVPRCSRHHCPMIAATRAIAVCDVADRTNLGSWPHRHAARATRNRSRLASCPPTLSDGGWSRRQPPTRLTNGNNVSLSS